MVLFLSSLWMARYIQKWVEETQRSGCIIYKKEVTISIGKLSSTLFFFLLSIAEKTFSQAGD